jgi:predicted dehydrogenase
VTVAREDELQVALIGFGLGGAAFHAPFIAATPGMRLAAVVTASEQRRDQVRRQYPDASIYDDAESLFHATNVDLAVVSTPNRTHASLAHLAVDADVPVLVDKPLAHSAAAARRLVDDARKRGVLLSAYQNRRWDGDFRTLRRLVDDRALGRVHRFESRFDRWRPDVRASWKESAEPEDAGGVLFDLGSHLIDQALVLFGAVTHVYAELDRRRAGVDVDDDAFVALTHASGVRSQLWMSLVAAQEGPRFRVSGERAAYTKWGTDVQEAALRAERRPGAPGWGEEPESAWGRLGIGGDARPVPTEPGDYRALYEQLGAALRGEAPNPVDPMDAVRALEVIEAAQKSAREQRVVEVRRSR